MAHAFRRRTLFRACSWLAILALALVLTAVSCAKVEMTASGAHQRLLIPIVVGAVGVPAYSGTGEDVFMEGHLAGPVVRTGNDGTWSATWFCEDESHAASGRGPVLELQCAGRWHRFHLASAPLPPAIDAMPRELAVLSDIEGNAAFLEAALLRLGIVSPGGEWSYGDGQLVILGDSVDRGRDVFAVLWRLHALARQAHAAGGAVRVVLGNHEQYLLRGNISRAHPDYRYALQQMGGYEAAFADDTVIGHWLRQQPVVLQLGDVLFTHAGISPGVAASGLDANGLNAAMRGYWRQPEGGKPETGVLEATLGLSGVTRYRGYFMNLEGQYGKATPAEVAQVLETYGAKQMVVGHTLVEGVQGLYGDRVFAVDVNDDGARTEVLVYTDGKPRVVDIGTKRNLEASQASRHREFSLLDSRDRRLIASMYTGFQALSRIPMPY